MNLDENSRLFWFVGIVMAAIAAILILAFCAIGNAIAGDYRASVTRVVDGDTFDAMVEVWPDIIVKSRIRITPIDTPEVKAATQCERDLARRSTIALEALIAAKVVTISTDRKDAFGRMLASVRILDTDIGAKMIAGGYARIWKAGTHGGWC